MGIQRSKKYIAAFGHHQDAAQAFRPCLRRRDACVTVFPARRERFQSQLRYGFTTIEIMIVVVIVAIVAIAVMPDPETSAKQEGQRAADRFAGDLAYARSLSIARPDDPVIIKADVDNNRYWLARAITPDTPIAHPRTGLPYLRSFGEDGDAGLRHVAIFAQDFGDDAILGFDAVGSLDQDGDAVLQFTSCGASYEIVVVPSTAEATTHARFTVDVVALELPGGGSEGSSQGGGGSPIPGGDE